MKVPLLGLVSVMKLSACFVVFESGTIDEYTPTPTPGPADSTRASVTFAFTVITEPPASKVAFEPHVLTASRVPRKADTSALVSVALPQLKLFDETFRNAGAG
ncbi:MAG: hypothetical protein ABI321_23500, partial [Polyangia bacterium]